MPDSLVGTLQAYMKDLRVVDVPTHTCPSSPRANLSQVKPGFLTDFFSVCLRGCSVLRELFRMPQVPMFDMVWNFFDYIAQHICVY